MARTTFETLKVFWLTSAPVDSNAPTEAELTAGTDLSSEIPVDGVQFGGTANNASQAMLGDAFVAEDPGTWGRSLEITYMVDPSGTSEAWDLFTYRTEGYFVFIFDGDGSDGDLCHIWHVKGHEKQLMASAENEYQKFSVTYAAQVAPELNGVVGGS